MVFISKKEGTKKDGTPKKDVKEIKTSKGLIRYTTTKETKDKLTKPKNKEIVEKKKTIKTLKNKGVKPSLTENID